MANMEENESKTIGTVIAICIRRHISDNYDGLLYEQDGANWNCYDLFAIKDGKENIIHETYATKEELANHNTGNAKGFKILKCDTHIEDNGIIGLYTLSSIEGIQIGDIYYASLKDDKYNFGTVISIVPELSTIAVNNYKEIELEDETNNDPENGKVVNYLTIVDKPQLGDMQISYNATILGKINQAVGEDSFVSGKNNIAIGKQSAVFGDGNIAVNQAMATGYETYALGANSNTSGFKTKALGTNACTGGTNTVSFGNNASAGGYGRNEISLENILQGALKDKETAIANWKAYGKSFNVAYGHNSTTAGIDNLAAGD